MPYKLKITGPGPNDFEWVWEDAPTPIEEQYPQGIELPEGQVIPRAPYNEDLPDVVPPPADAPAADSEKAVPRPRIRITPSPRQADTTPIIPDAIDNVFPEPPVPVSQPDESIPSMQPLRQLQAAAISAPSSIYDVGASVLEQGGPIAAAFMRMPPNVARQVPTPQLHQDVAGILRRAGESARQQTRNWFGATEEPQDVLSRIGRTTGESIVPAAKNAALLSAIVAGSNVGVNETRRALKSSALTDFQVPPEWLSGSVVSPAMAAPNQFNAPSANHTIMETVGGPKKVSNNELYAVGSIVLATAGMVFGPRIYNRFRSGDLPRMRPIADTPSGTVAISKPGDLALTHHDANSGAMRLLRRTGIDPVAANEVETTMRIQTRAQANGMADSAINAGRMETPAFTFQSRVPLARLAPLETQPVRDYLHIMDTIDDLKTRSLSLLSGGQNVVPVVRGHDLVSAGAVRRGLEAANPEVAQVAREYWDITRNLRNFEATGEYATVSRAQNASLKRERPHEVPMHPRQIGADFERGSAVESLGNDMRNRIRARIENEAKGKYIDAARRQMPNLFTQVSAEQLRDNPRWRRNVVDIQRRGVAEHWVTDPFLAGVLRMDPYYITGNTGSLLYATKRALEVTTTGELAPWFAFTNMYRSWGIGKFTVEDGMRSPTFIGTHTAIPRQLLPQLGNWAGQRLENGSLGWLNGVFGQGSTQALGTRMVNAYANSLYAQLQTVGGSRGSILQQQTSANNRLTRAIQRSQGPARQFLEAYRSLLNAVHNAAAFDYARRNQGRVSLPELGRRARNLTGDPRIGGEYYTNVPGSGKATPIRFVDDTSHVSHTLGNVAKVHGYATELGRTSLPWYNATVQGMKRLGEAYTDNPSKFTTRAWMYYIAPTASLYLGTKSLGKDPNGRSYIDYAQNGRSEYNKTMNWYIPIPGRPAEEGIEFPAFHELTMAKRMTDVAMDHAIGDSPFTESEDMRKAAQSVADVLFPALPPASQIIGAYGNVVLPQGPFGGEPYQRQVTPFDQLSGMPDGLEKYVRAITPGIGDIVGTGYAAAAQTPEGFFQRLWNGTKAGARRVVEKTPVVRNILGITSPRTGNTAVMEELFAKSKEINQLDRFFKTWTDQEGLVGGKKAPSIAGSEIATGLFGPRPTRQSAGIDQPPPTNPLYKMFMVEVHDKFKRDTPRTGGMGFNSMWDRFRMSSEQIRRLRKVNEGNQVTWERQMDERPEQIKILKDNNINYKDIKSVRNFYERQRQDIARVMLSKIREVENDFSQRLGQKITLKDLDPYKAGLKEGGASDLIDTIPDPGAPQ